jgi:FkbM family methyltransferase
VTQGEGQIWSGFWEIFEPVPVELIPYWPGYADGYAGIRVRDNADVQIIHEIDRNYGYKLGIRWLPVAPTIIDVGAHIGVFTVYAKRVRPRAYIIAVETNLHNLQQCMENCKFFADTHFERAALHYGTDLRFTVTSHAHMYILGPSGTPLDVPVITLETLAERYQLDEVHFIKLDCEGSEFSILEHGKDWIKQHVHMIGGEYHLGYPDSKPWEEFVDAHYADWIRVRDTRFSSLGVGDFLLINPKSECAKYL